MLDEGVAEPGLENVPLCLLRIWSWVSENIPQVWQEMKKDRRQAYLTKKTSKFTTKLV